VGAGGEPEAAAGVRALLDFYEENGQPEKAAAWRTGQQPSLKLDVTSTPMGHDAQKGGV
jgi:hypothetical protein